MSEEWVNVTNRITELEAELANHRHIIEEWQHRYMQADEQLDEARAELAVMTDERDTLQTALDYAVKTAWNLERNDHVCDYMAKRMTELEMELDDLRRRRR